MSVPRSVLLVATFALFLVWSNTFVAFEVLLRPKTGVAPLDWWGLVVVRNLPVAWVCAMWCFVARPRESWRIVRLHWVRLFVCGALVVPVYHACVYHGMQLNVAGPIVSLLTSLSPLYLVLFGVLLFGERATPRKLTGLTLGLAGLVLVATARDAASVKWIHVAEVAVAPLAWAVYSTITKPIVREHSAILWTYLVLVAGTLLLIPAIAILPAPDLTRVRGIHVALVLYLGLVATVGGNAVWSWLLRHLPASTAGMTIFLNPPLTLISKAAWAALFPAVFGLTIATQEWAGGLVMLAGVALAVLPGRARTPAATAAQPADAAPVPATSGAGSRSRS